MNRFNIFKFIYIMKQVQMPHYFRSLWLDSLLLHSTSTKNRPVKSKQCSRHTQHLFNTTSCQNLILAYLSPSVRGSGPRLAKSRLRKSISESPTMQALSWPALDPGSIPRASANTDGTHKIINLDSEKCILIFHK